MADIKKTIQRSKTDDLRRVETQIEESVQGAATERTTTVKEEVIPMAVKKVVKETIVPVVTSRQIESYEDGKVVNTEHEVVPDEALLLSEYEKQISHNDIAKIVNDAIRQNLSAIKNELKTPQHVFKEAPITAQQQIVERNAPPSVLGFEIDMSMVLYAVVAVEAAALIYLTVLKGWLLN